MATRETAAYTVAKEAYDNIGLRKDETYDIEGIQPNVLRKHLSEMVKRKGFEKKFASRFNKQSNQIKIFRIE